jgi:hypothetical protein
LIPVSQVTKSFGADKLRAVRDRLPRFGCLALVLLIACTFFLDVVHGVRLGQDQVAFHPIYRLRQSLAVAISRRHDPPLGGYLAYGSVVNVLNENGFAMFDGEPGPHLDFNGWETLLSDGPRLDRIIQEAKDVAIDHGLPPQTIQGNELGLADYIDLSCRLFGAKISSLYYFYYLIIFVSGLLYVVQFRNSPFLLFLMVVFLGELFFLANYANAYGTQLETVTNSRLFSGPSLLPALHILFVLWQRLPFRAVTAGAVIVQSVIFAFLLSCRTEAAWQLAMIVAVACGIGLLMLLRPRGQHHLGLIGRLAALWPAAVLVLVVSAYSAVLSISADRRYAREPEGHVIWHEVILGLLATSPDLRREYVGNVPSTNVDQDVYVAVINDLKARNDFSSPIVRKLPDGDITLDILAAYGEYDKLARSLALRMIIHRPFAVIAGVPQKIANQIEWYTNPHRQPMSWGRLRVAVVLTALGALLCMVAGGFTAERAALAGAAACGGIVLLFASLTPLIEPSALSIGSLFSYLGAIAVVVAFTVALSIRGLFKLKAMLGGASSPAQSAQ